MKRTVISILLALITAYAVNAQDLTSKKGTPILPETGDYSFSIDAVPFFVYLGNMFHGTDATAAPTFDFPGLNNVPMWTFQVKKIVSPTMAMRARIRLGYSCQTYKNTIADQTDTVFSLTPSLVDDKWTESRMNIVLGAGIEKRRGKGRVQGVYGAMANIMIGTHGKTLTYGNNLSTTYRSPLSTVWNDDGSVSYVEPKSSRILKDNDGLAFGIGVNAFLGVEYFFAPKMSIGGELTWGLMLQVTGKSKTETEAMDVNSKTTITKKIGGATFIGIDNGNSGGAINLNFYF